MKAFVAAMLLVGVASAAAAKPEPVQRRAAPAARDWTAMATVAPGGGIVLGNPAAKVRLVEYASFTCPHCARFWADAFATLKARYVRTGAVSFEVRNFMRDRVDLAAALLARCGTPPQFFARSDALFAHQQEWLPDALSADSMQGQQLSPTPPADVLAAIAAGGGLGELLRPQGLAPGHVGACLADQSGQDRIVALLVDAQRHGVAATPGFLINGNVVPASTWSALEPLLRAALAG